MRTYTVIRMRPHSADWLAMKWSSVCLVLFILLSAALVSRAEGAANIRSTSTNVSTRVEQTLNGLFHYYWRSDPYRKNVQFFFACGQIGGGETSDYGTCSCDNPTACTFCYRWWDAIALESVATHGIYTNTKNHSQIASTIFAHSPYNADWNATAACTNIDDFSWYGIAYLRVYEWLKVCYAMCVVLITVI